MSDSGRNGYRTSPLYTFKETARLADVSITTVRNWLYGYSTDYGDVAPLFPQDGGLLQDPEHSPMVSFLQMIEIVVAARFRKAEGIRYKTVREAHLNLKKETGVQHPFARYDLEALGRHILMPLERSRSRASRQTADSLTQWTLPGLVVQTQDQFDWDSKLVSRWYPIGKTVPIVIDPQFSAGLPTIVDRGVTVGGIFRRFKAHQSMDFIAQDLVLERDVVEEVVRYADQHILV